MVRNWNICKRLENAALRWTWGDPEFRITYLSKEQVGRWAGLRVRSAWGSLQYSQFFRTCSFLCNRKQRRVPEGAVLFNRLSKLLRDLRNYPWETPVNSARWGAATGPASWHRACCWQCCFPKTLFRGGSHLKHRHRREVGLASGWLLHWQLGCQR